MNRRTITVPEYARILGCAKNTAYKAARDGQIPGVIRVGKRYMVPRSVVERLLGEKLDMPDGHCGVADAERGAA